jgi:hypothetical protein
MVWFNLDAFLDSVLSSLQASYTLPSHRVVQGKMIGHLPYPEGDM